MGKDKKTKTDTKTTDPKAAKPTEEKSKK